MDEHDDDLESEVHDGAQKETDSYPDTGDELNDEVSERAEHPDSSDPDAVLDTDEAEL